MADAETELATRILELMVLTAWADGKVEGSEALAIHHQVAALPLWKKVASTAEVSRRTRARMQQIGLEEALRESARGIGARADRELAFQCCVRVMGADGDLQGEELGVLGTLQEAFALRTEDVKRLLVQATRSA